MLNFGECTCIACSLSQLYILPLNIRLTIPSHNASLVRLKLVLPKWMPIARVPYVCNPGLPPKRYLQLIVMISAALSIKAHVHLNRALPAWSQ